MSIKFPRAMLGPEMAAPILWAPGIFCLFLLENPHAVRPTAKFGILLRTALLLAASRASPLLSRRALCGHHFPGNCRYLSCQRWVCGVVNLGGVVAVFCQNLRFPAVFCENLRLPNAIIPRKSENLQKSAKISAKNCEFGSVCPI